MRSKLILILAILMGLVTTFLFYRYVEGLDKGGTIAAETKMTEVMVASRDIIRYERVTPDMIKMVQVPEGANFPGTLTDSAGIDGKFALTNIKAGEPIVEYRIRDEKEESLIVARKLAKNKRAVSLGLNFVQSVSNLIEPEDWVDVIHTRPGQPSQGIEAESEIILQRVRVLAVGMRMLEKNEGDGYVEYSSATLEMTADEAVKAVNAANDGIITLTLHGRIDNTK